MDNMDDMDGMDSMIQYGMAWCGMMDFDGFRRILMDFDGFWMINDDSQILRGSKSSLKGPSRPRPDLMTQVVVVVGLV